MTAHKESRVVPYSAALMFSIVADVEHYPDFLPWVAGMRLLSRETQGTKTITMAEMLVGFRAYRERYTSRVTADETARTIDVEQTQGVFRHLNNHWHFTPEGDGCRIDFTIDFAFRSRLLNAVAGSAFSHALSQMTHAFEKRAAALSR
ncbi:MAG TPA: type II toxin-antitoxin system RatA family toxin [Rhizomicrobium sp.]|nr:type II toxin-antitoxin system RatA family toxin [Rhizomicrobium sp.]